LPYLKSTIMAYIKVHIHFVWSTKKRYPFLETQETRKKVWNHIRENGRKKGIFIDQVGGYADHCHCLISLGSDQTIQKIMHLIKGESSFWINKNQDFKDQLKGKKFEWQIKYFAVSVSESALQNVRNYIQKQEQHHSSKTFKDELDEFITKYNFREFRDDE